MVAKMREGVSQTFQGCGLVPKGLNGFPNFHPVWAHGPRSVLGFLKRIHGVRGTKPRILEIDGFSQPCSEQQSPTSNCCLREGKACRAFISTHSATHIHACACAAGVFMNKKNHEAYKPHIPHNLGPKSQAMRRLSFAVKDSHPEGVPQLLPGEFYWQKASRLRIQNSEGEHIPSLLFITVIIIVIVNIIVILITVVFIFIVIIIVIVIIIFYMPTVIH